LFVNTTFGILSSVNCVVIIVSEFVSNYTTYHFVNVTISAPMSCLSLPSLPLEVLYHILSHCSIPDVIAVSMALATPSLTDIFKITKLWKQAVIGPRMLDRSVHFLGDHVDQLIIRGRLQFDRNCKPKKEKFFKSCELLPEHISSYS
jgi:hypothetical protein